MARRRYRGGGVVWPLLLVLVGGLLLLNNLGLIDRSLWSMAFQLWPAILLAIGVDILIPRRSVWGTLVAIVAVSGVFLGSFWLLDRIGQRSASGVELSQPLAGVESAEIQVEPAIGFFRLDGEAAPGLLVEGSADPIGPEPPASTYTASGGRGRFRLTPGARPGVTVVFPTNQVVWELSVADNLPLDLQAEMGVGEMNLDLSAVQVGVVESSFGVGRTAIVLPADRDVEVTVDGGVGEVLLEVPAGADVRIVLDRGLTTLTLPAGYSREDTVARSPRREAGAPKIQVRIGLGVGTIRIVERSPGP